MFRHRVTTLTLQPPCRIGCPLCRHTAPCMPPTFYTLNKHTTAHLTADIKQTHWPSPCSSIPQPLSVQRVGTTYNSPTPVHARESNPPTGLRQPSYPSTSYAGSTTLLLLLLFLTLPSLLHLNQPQLSLPSRAGLAQLFH